MKDTFAHFHIAVIMSPNTSFLPPSDPGRPAFRLVLIQVDRNIEMVDQGQRSGRPLESTGEFKACL
jgi:hypothetical protein